MDSLAKILLTSPIILSIITGCSSHTSTYINSAELVENNVNNIVVNPVYFKAEDSFKTSPPRCITIMPLIDVIGKIDDKKQELVRNPMKQASITAHLSYKYNLLDLNEQVLEQMRWNLYLHLASHRYRDVELAKVN